MPHIDPTPSTFDVLPRIAGGQDDRVLECLQVARGRIEKDWTVTAYVSNGGAVCAYGGVMAAAFGDDKASNPTDDVGHFFTPSYWEGEEREAAKVAMEAIGLVNEVACDLFPVWDEHSGYEGPVERVNQLSSGEVGANPDEYDTMARQEGDETGELAQKLRVLTCYDEAIRRRAGREPAHA